MENYKGIEYLRAKLGIKRDRVLLRYRYYEMKNTNVDAGVIIPSDLKERYRSILGWCAKAVDSLADRLIFDGFKNDDFNMWEIYQLNNPDILFDSAIIGALISACDFIYISADEDGFPRMQVIDGANATGIIDPITNMLKEGYAVLERDEFDIPVTEAYFTAGRTDIITVKNRGVVTETYTNKAPFALLVPIIYRPDSVRPFGHSRISRACMNLVDKARFTLTRGEITSEFYSFPQKYILGMNPDAEQMEKWKATISSMLRIDKDEDGDKPVVGQFQTSSMTPHIEQLRMYAANFGGETGLTLDDLGFATGNPASAEAIKAAHENLRLTARKAQRTFGTGFLNAGFLACCLRDNIEYARNQMYRTTATWMPIFEPDAAMLSAIGDGAIKVNQAIPEYFDANTLYSLTGIKGNGE